MNRNEGVASKKIYNFVGIFFSFFVERVKGFRIQVTNHTTHRGNKFYFEGRLFFLRQNKKAISFFLFSRFLHLLCLFFLTREKIKKGIIDIGWCWVHGIFGGRFNGVGE